MKALLAVTKNYNVLKGGLCMFNTYAHTLYFVSDLISCKEMSGCIELG